MATNNNKKPKPKVKIDFMKPMAKAAKKYADENPNENLNELEFEKIFNPSTIQRLKSQTAARKQQMLGTRSPISAAMSTTSLARALQRIETPYKDGLEEVALDVVYDLYPRLQQLVKQGKIRIDAKLGGGAGEMIEPQQQQQQKQKQQTPQEEELPPTLEDIEIAKRRIINSITQGGSVTGAFGFLYSDIKDNLDAIDDGLMDKYKEFLNLTFGSYADDQVVAAFLAQIAQSGAGNMAAGGVKGKWVKGKVEEKPPKPSQYNPEEDDDKEGEGGGEDEEYYLISARGICFAILIHEILKGYFEYLSYEGFSPKKSLKKNVAIVTAADKLKYEPTDLQTGPEIYQAITDLFNNSNYDDLRLRDLLIGEIYKLEDREFVDFIENAINDELTFEQKNWIEKTLRKLSLRLSSQDTGFDLGGEDDEEDDEEQFA
jgi:hypothetical protein